MFFNLLILTDHFYLCIRNQFLAVAHEQTPHIARILSLLRDAITEDDDDDDDYSCTHHANNEEANKSAQRPDLFLHKCHYN